MSLATMLLTASQALALPHFANTPAPEHFCALRDRLGSIMGLVDSNGNLTVRYDYDAWGNPVLTQPSLNLSA